MGNMSQINRGVIVFSTGVMAFFMAMLLYVEKGVTIPIHVYNTLAYTSIIIMILGIVDGAIGFWEGD